MNLFQEEIEQTAIERIQRFAKKQQALYEKVMERYNEVKRK